MHRLSVNYREFNDNVDKLINLESNLINLTPKYQKLVAEIILLRLFFVLEETFSTIAGKLVCGAEYIDGSIPNSLITCRSIEKALDNMRTYGRGGTYHQLKWGKASEIKENLRYILDANENYIRTVDFHASFIDELRKIRNRIAHNNSTTRIRYQIVVKRYYGANLNGITAGTLLLSPRRSPNLLQQYLIKAKILIKTMTKA